VIGWNSVRLNKDKIIASCTLVADGVYCDYDPIKQRASPAPKKKSRAQALLKNCVDPISPKSGFDLD